MRMYNVFEDRPHVLKLIQERIKQLMGTSKNSQTETDVKTLIEYILSVYPNSNIVNMTKGIYSNNRLNKHVKRLNKLTMDDNNFIVIENRGTHTLEKFINGYLTFKKQPIRNTFAQFSSSSLVLFRSNNFVMVPSSELKKIDEIKSVLKSQFKPRQRECLLCLHEFQHNEQKQTCCNCHVPVCASCFKSYIKKVIVDGVPFVINIWYIITLHEWIHQAKNSIVCLTNLYANSCCIE